jgi:hypothetical protein
MTAVTLDPLRWDLSSIYSSLTDPRIDTDLEAALNDAQALNAKFKSRVSRLEPDTIRGARGEGR